MKIKFLIGVMSILLSLLVVNSCTTQEVTVGQNNIVKEIKADYPVVAKRPIVTNIHEYSIVDDYSWLKDIDRKNKEILDYVREENQYAEKKLSKLADFKKKLYNEIIGRIDQSDVSVPVRLDDYLYYSRDVEGKQYSVYCRKLKDMNAEEEILLDLNKLSKNHKFIELGSYKVSPDNRFLAYTLDTSGNEHYTLYINYLQYNKIMPITIERVDDIEWSNDSRNIYYSTTNEENERTDKVFRHVIGTKLEDDKLLYREDDPSFYVWVNKTKDKKYLLIGTANKTTSEMRYLATDNPLGSLTMVVPRKEGVEYYMEHHDNKFYILTNEKRAKNFKIMTVDEHTPYSSKWNNYYEHRRDVYLEDYELFENYFVTSEISKGKRTIRVIDYESLIGKEISFDEAAYTVSLAWNPNFDSNKLRYIYESLTTPYSIVDYDMKTGKKEFLKQQKVLGGYDRIKYKSEKIFARSKDGTMVPISLVYSREKFKNDGKNPLLLYGYGAYGDSNDPYFSSSRLSMLDRGFVFALAHTRGGRENGEKWYEDGKLLNKKNTFNDFIACAEHLITKKYTSSDKMIIEGASAGGLLIGAVLNMRPELFKSAVLEVPFLDVINTMLDPSLSATVSEYDEWGDPNDKFYFDYIRSYCPYQNIKAQNYPNIYVTAGFNDPRVNYWEPAKWVAKLRETKTDNNTILLKINTAGHGGSSGRYDYYKELALKYAYMLDQVGITE
ncbi:MAG: S9 family peptidase [Candidatus Delongbacteria bacterium]|jgi:oligopeptidase B|nr:S9 family peptidase [Candidatus Delongbacteria bacterium]